MGKARLKPRPIPSAGRGLIFKGSGFVYNHDYRSENYKGWAKKERPSAPPLSGGDFGKSPADSKPPARVPSNGKRSPLSGRRPESKKPPKDGRSERQ